MPDPNPLLERLAAARPPLPPGLRARALAAGRAAWMPWWRRLSTWTAAAAAVLALDVSLMMAGGPPPSAPQPVPETPSAPMALSDDQELDAWIQRRLAFADAIRRPRQPDPGLDARRQVLTDIMKETL